MKLLKLCAAAAAAVLLGAAAPAVAANPPTAAEFARAPDITDVDISRDGKHMVALTSPDGDEVTISVWRMDALREKPFIIGAKKMRILGVGFLKNDRLLVTAIQPYTLGDTRTHLVKQFVTNLKGEDWKPLLGANGPQTPDEALVNALSDATLLDRLPLDPRNVLVVDNRLGGEGDIYRVDVYSGAAERIARAIERTGDYVTDLAGEIRARQRLDYDNGSVYFAQLFKNPDTGAWDEHFRWYAKDREPITVLGFDRDPNIAYVAATRGGDKTGIYSYDIRARKFVEPLFEHKLFDAVGIVRSWRDEDYGRILGFGYMADKLRIYWVDETRASIEKGARQALGVKTDTVAWVDPGGAGRANIPVPEGADVTLLETIPGGGALIEKSGPDQPAQYYLLGRDGKLSLLGASRPWIDTDALGSTRLVEYAARDGLMIPAILTTPPARFGSGPHPALILPHGGPWARDYMDWDVSGWTQYFASRGYAVLRPQFRGSEGWGQKLWRAGDAEWGQKMQDDKDDGAKWLIEQGIADPQRIAMFGYSYGGYAALVAAIRPNGLYQCAISGAGAGDLASIKLATFEDRLQREFQNPTIRGLDPLDHAREAQIPVLLYHGDRDQTVDIKQSRKFADQLKAAGKPYKFIEIPDMGHQYAKMTPAMLELQLVEVERFLRNDCGPGGL